MYTEIIFLIKLISMVRSAMVRSYRIQLLCGAGERKVVSCMHEEWGRYVGESGKQ